MLMKRFCLGAAMISVAASVLGTSHMAFADTTYTTYDLATDNSNPSSASMPAETRWCASVILERTSRLTRALGRR